MPTAPQLPPPPDLSNLDQAGWYQPNSVEEAMLSNGTMLESDLQLDAPHFGLGVSNPAILEAHVDYYESRNTAAASGSRLLTSREAHLPGPPPPSTTQFDLLEMFSRLCADEEETQLTLPSLGAPNPPLDMVCDIEEADFTGAGDSGFGDEDELDARVPEPPGPDERVSIPNEDAPANSLAETSPMSDASAGPPAGNDADPDVCQDRWDALMRNAPWDDREPDPFYPQPQASYNAPDLRQIPAHLLCIYAMVPWAHLHFGLPVIAANALLLCFAVVVTLLAPFAPTPFLTLKKVNDLMGLEVPFQVLAVCPTCKDVYANSPDSPALCTRCATPLFKPNRPPSNWYQRGPGVRAPVIKYPYMSLSEQLTRLLQVDGMEDLLDVAKELLGPDGRPFFENAASHHARGPDNELRLALEWAVDWFSYLKSNIAPSHSSCPTSFAICNLPPQMRYRTANLLLTSILPGPKEQNPDELQRFMRPIVSDLLRLWRDGIMIKTPLYPEGRCVRVALIAVVCDKPAAHKMGGFGSHSHTFFCTQDWITQSDKATSAAFEERARTDAQHRQLGARYAALTTQNSRDKFVREHATRYTELSRLPYFNIIEQVVVDPMHNLFLGLVKTHFYHIWVQMGILREKHELRVLHDMLRDFSVPAAAGKLPKDIGTPAGGSLTADQWRLLAVVQGPIIIPQLWRKCLPQDPTKLLNDRVERIAREEAAKQDKLREAVRARAQLKDQRSAAGSHMEPTAPSPAPSHPSAQGPPPVPCSSSTTTNTATRPPASTHASTTKTGTPTAAQAKQRGEQVYSLHPEDPAHFLKLSEALRILTAHVLTTDDIEESAKLLRAYGKDLIRLYGTGAIRPNHHYATHVPDFALKFGPLHEFWSFLFERLNKVLKSFNANNRGDGDLETTFFAEFHRTTTSSRTVAFLNESSANFPLLQRLGSAMTKVTQDSRGTVGGLAAWAKQADEDLSSSHPFAVPYHLSPRKATRAMSSQTYKSVLRHFWRRYPAWHVHSMFGTARYIDSVPLVSSAVFYDYVAITGRRYYASSEAVSKHSSYVEVYTSDYDGPSGDRPSACGELEEVLEFCQADGMPAFWFGRMRWFRPWLGDREAVWDNPKRLGVQLWHLEEYLPADGPLDHIVPLTHIKGYLALKTVSVGASDTKVWATIPLDSRARF
ncbi:hypothetical protein VTO73DRAFT_7797 [Trametes versicolor]